MGFWALMEGRDGRGTTTGTGEKGRMNVVSELLQVMEKVGSFMNFRRTQRKECLNLVRRLKLLVPFLEEIRELSSSNYSDDSDKAFNFLLKFKKALLSAKKLLSHCNYGSKIYLALENEAIMSRFHVVYDKLKRVLDDVPYEDLGVSDDVKEQVELMRMQLQRAKSRTETQDIELAMDMMIVFSKNDDRKADDVIIERLAKKLEIHTIPDLRSETMAVKKLLKDNRSQSAESIQQIVDLLGKFKQIAGIEGTCVLDFTVSSRCLGRCQSLLMPNEFLCPITLEIMTDPVIVATGQTYERESIKKWLNSNHRTCPKTGQTLRHLTMVSNFALRSLIQQWCERNNFDLPRKNSNEDFESSSIALVEEIAVLVQNLSSPQLDVQSDAVVKIRMLSKENPDNRILISNCGGIPPLVRLLSYPDLKIQEHSVTAILNLSLDEANKRHIAREGGIPTVIDILKYGTNEARENSAAALLSLSMLDENKVMVGCLDGIPPLVDLLQTGTTRGRKDAATALFNLTLNQANKTRAIKAGIMPALLNLLTERGISMVDEALSILFLLASHPEGRNEIGQLSVIQTLVEIIREGTCKNKECATAVLLELCLKNTSLMLGALQYGVYEHLVELTRCGTNRGQRKATSLLQLMIKCEQIP
ncbi:hypothetical protein ACH5RR_002510 [Cinchona calisaya]|uniref:RING-type E3 ubiquitin transferase n=1 Tax=Cinchona calisaya TaxID=153742 RepID=A0ABD3B6I9_9GENT